MEDKMIWFGMMQMEPSKTTIKLFNILAINQSNNSKLMKNIIWHTSLESNYIKN